MLEAVCCPVDIPMQSEKQVRCCGQFGRGGKCGMDYTRRTGVWGGL